MLTSVLRSGGSPRVGEPPLRVVPATARPNLEPLHLLSLVIGATAVILLVIPISDIDSYWHVVIGSQILSGTPLHDVGRTWLAEPGNARNWLTSQWLSEVALAWAVQTWGWGGLVVGKLLLYIAALVACAVVLLPQRRAVISLPVFTACVIAIGSVTQERPQGASLIFIPLVALASQRIWTGGGGPPLLVAASLGCLWANLHGLWVIAPAAFSLVFLTSAITTRRLLAPEPRMALRATLASLIGGLINPLGPSSLLLPLGFKAAAGQIVEWQPTQLWSVSSAGFLLMVSLIGLAWTAPAGVRAPIPVTEWVWVIFWAMFALPAQRDVVVSTLMLAPVAAVALTRTFPMSPARSSAREQRVLKAAALGIIVISSVLLASSLVRLKPLAHTWPVTIARQLAASPVPLRVLNTYNASGPLIAFSQGSAKLAIDGRADLWRPKRIEANQDVARLSHDWRRTISEFDPDALVIAKASPLDELLRVTSTQWHRSTVDGPYVLWLRDRRSKEPILPQAR